MPRFMVILVNLGALLLAPQAGLAQDGGSLFTENCAPCHNIGEPGGAAPDLRGVSTRRDRAWLIAFVLDPASRDKAATMPPPDGISREQIVAILDYVDARSTSAPAGPAEQPLAAFTAEDVQHGQAIFVGRSRLDRGGPACLSCHDAGATAQLGGGSLGPDLSRLATRMNGARGTAAWLSAPPTPVMRSIFATAPLGPDEVHALTAFLVDRAAAGSSAAPQPLRFVALAALGSAAVFLVMAIAFRQRWRPVRRALIARAGHDVRAGGSR